MPRLSWLVTALALLASNSLLSGHFQGPGKGEKREPLMKRKFFHRLSVTAPFTCARLPGFPEEKLSSPTTR